MANNTNLSFPSAFCQQFFDENGKPLSSGKLYTYIAGSSTPVVTYKTISGGTESANMNTNPIILDMSGKANLVISKDTAYKFVLFDRNDVKVDEWDNVTAVGSEGGGSSEEIVVDGTTDEIDVTPNQVGGFMHYVVSLAAGIKSALSSLQETVNTLASSLSNKKDKQENSDTSSTATKTLTRITQDTNGVIYPHFDDIDYTPANRNIAPEYSSSETYPIIGTLRMNEGVLYRNKVAITTAEDWTESHWEVADIASIVSQGSESNIDIDFIRPVFVQQLTMNDDDLNYDARLDNLLYKLPSGYKKVRGVKNISNTTSHQIDTGISTDDGIDIELITAFFINSFVQYGQIVGNTYINSDTHYFSISCGASANTVNCFVNTNYNTLANKSFQNGSSICLRQTGSTRIAKDCYYPFNSYLATGTTGDANTSNIKMFTSPLVIIYSLYIKKGGVVVRDFIPCVRLSDNAAGFYDKISKSFFTSDDPSKLVAVYP